MLLIWRRVTSEFVGTMMLVTIVVGSGIAAQRMSHDAGLQLLENAAVTALGLGVLIFVLGPISGAHFNPLVSVADWALGHRTRSGLTPSDLAGYVVAQTTGAILGAVLANAMFGLRWVTWSTHDRSALHLLFGEVVATAGLLFAIIALVRSHRASQAHWVVASYIGAAYWFTSSTSFANPAVTVGRVFSNTFSGIAPASMPLFLIVQCVGATIGVALACFLFPHRRSDQVRS